MKVKINNKIYNSNQEPIMLILDEKDKKNISNMVESATKYISYPTGMKLTEIKKFKNTS